ncbi:phosphatidylserine/phosphatidylglycerophosphate/cardiolipin synthase family protein [Candidatus Woesearchaeota archaeon]|nr:phosphatidylserine/phosphatidylglycerophosphate/cardiolipin synthase family protein [Candidatus Woesearchaeota archaeon]
MFKVLVDKDFINDFLSTLKKAKHHIELQFMTFEADNAGKVVEKILLKKAKEGVRIRILIDRFSDFMISEKYRGHPSVREEYEQTKQMFKNFEKKGIAVKWTAPLGLLNLGILRRNHKKIICIDNHSYLCGFNISDHNFAWHDFGVKMDGKDAADIMHDFDSTWDGMQRPDRGNVITNPKRMRDFITNRIKRAEEEILITSAFVYDVHMLPLLARQARKGVKVVLVTPKKTSIKTYKWVRQFSTNYLLENGVHVHWYPKMLHSKGILIDRKLAIFGSSNYGEHSHLSTKEIIMHSRDKDLVKQLHKKVFLKDLKKSKPATMTPKIHLREMLLLSLFHGGIKVYGKIYGHPKPKYKSEMTLKKFWKNWK